MEWNWCWSGNNAYSLYESTGDSEEVKTDNHNHTRHENEATTNENEVESFRVHVNDDVVDDDDNDAQSCSYDHSSYINPRCSNTKHDQSQRLIYDDVGYDDDDNDDDDDDKDWGESKLMNPSKKQKRSHNYCVDSLNQREIDRKFWEACLAT